MIYLKYINVYKFNNNNIKILKIIGMKRQFKNKNLHRKLFQQEFQNKKPIAYCMLEDDMLFLFILLFSAFFCLIFC